MTDEHPNKLCFRAAAEHSVPKDILDAVTLSFVITCCHSEILTLLVTC